MSSATLSNSIIAPTTKDRANRVRTISEPTQELVELLNGVVITIVVGDGGGGDGGGGDGSGEVRTHGPSIPGGVSYGAG